jgi:uncharacterized protein
MLLTALILGLAGSLHCAGMCGPLVLLTPVVGSTRASMVASRLLYHGGRIAIYAALGLVFGAVGESVAFAGFQRWLSILVGVLMLVAVLAAGALKAQLWRMPLKLKSLFGTFLRKPTFSAVFALGAINGLLPCGLVYMAAAASIASGSALAAIQYMAAFGVGTLPVMLFISLAGKRLTFAPRPWLQKLAPISAAAVAILLIVRGQPLTLLTSSSPPVSCPACASR